MTSLALIALLMEWVVVITTATPILLQATPLRSTRPRTVIALWFGAMLASGLVSLVAFALAAKQAVDFWFQLESQRDSTEKLLWAFIYSFAPWLLLALGGIAIALINQKLEPLIEKQRDLNQALEQLSLKRHLTDSTAFEVFEVQLDAPLAFTSTLASRSKIVVSSGLKALLTESEFKAVVLHEQAHIRQRHQTLKKIATFIQRITPGIAASKILKSQLEALCEFSADDSAIRQLKRVGLDARFIVGALQKMQTSNPNPLNQERLNRLATKAS